MLVLADLIFLIVLLTTNVTLYADQDYPFPATLDEVVEVKLHRESWREDGTCWYTGLMVPYTKPVEAPESAHRPGDAAEVVEGYAVVLNQKTCADTVQTIERLGVAPHSKGGFLKQNFMTAVDGQELKPEQRPAWYAQVMDRIERLAAQDDKAQAFLARSRPQAH